MPHTDIQYVKRQVRKYVRKNGSLWSETYWYYRRFGAPDDGKRLPGQPGQAEFHSTLDGFNRRAERRDPTTIEGTTAWLISKYRAAPEFKQLADRTRYDYILHLTRLHEALGEFDAGAVTRKAIYAIRDAMQDTPSHANATLRVIGLLFSWGLDQELVEKNPAIKLRLLKVSPRNQLWSYEEEEAFLRHADLPMRRAFLFQMHTAQRQADMIAMTWEKYRNGLIIVRQAKTGALVWAPASDKLRAELGGMERGRGRMFLDENGKPWTQGRFSERFRETARAAGVTELQNRDLRRTAIVRLAEAGLTVPQIVAISGHQVDRTARILEVYMPRSAKMAEEGMKKFNGAERRREKAKRDGASDEPVNRDGDPPDAGDAEEDAIAKPVPRANRRGPPHWKEVAGAAQRAASAQKLDKERRPKRQGTQPG